MRKLFFVFTLAICMFAVSAHAATMKVGVFSIDQVGRNTDAFKELTANLQKNFSAEGKELENADAALKEDYNKFQMKQQALSAEAREDMQVELSLAKRSLDDRMNNYFRKLAAAEKRISEDITKVVLYAAQQVGKNGKYDLVMEQQNGGIIFFADALDISKQVLEEANKAWKQKPKELGLSQ